MRLNNVEFTTEKGELLANGIIATPTQSKLYHDFILGHLAVERRLIS